MKIETLEDVQALLAMLNAERWSFAERVAINRVLEPHCMARECPTCLQPHLDRLEIAYGILHAARLDSDLEENQALVAALDAALRHYMWAASVPADVVRRYLPETA